MLLDQFAAERPLADRGVAVRQVEHRGEEPGFGRRVGSRGDVDLVDGEVASGAESGREEARQGPGAGPFQQRARGAAAVEEFPVGLDEFADFFGRERLDEGPTRGEFLDPAGAGQRHEHGVGQLVDDRRGALGDLAVMLVAAFVGVPVTAFVARGRGADVAFGGRVDFFSEGEDEFPVFFELRDPAVRERAPGLADVDVTGFLVDRQALARVFAELARAFAFGAEGELEFPIAVEDLDPAHVRVQRVDVARFPVDVEAVDVAPFAGRHHGAVVGVDFSEFAERHELGCAFFFGGVRRRDREGGECEHREHRDDRNRRTGMRAHRSRRRPRLRGEWRRLRRGRGR